MPHPTPLPHPSAARAPSGPALRSMTAPAPALRVDGHLSEDRAPSAPASTAAPATRRAAHLSDGVASGGSPGPRQAGASSVPPRPRVMSQPAASGRTTPAQRSGDLSEDARNRKSDKYPLPPLLLVGCGRMGGALLSGWLEQGLPEAVVVEPNAAAAAAWSGRATVVPSAADIPEGFRPQAVVLAIKPQEAAAALPAFGRYAGTGAVFVSIMAGQPVAGIRAALGDASSVVRAMPNTPASVRQGFTVGFAGPGVTAPQRALADRLLGAVGEVAWVDREALIDPVTAVSGGGPAYVFLLAELLEAAAIEQGLDPDLARRLARATVAGSGALLAASAEDSASLRRAVTSPKGTTERALAVLMAPEAWPALLSRAIHAATERSRELAG